MYSDPFTSGLSLSPNLPPLHRAAYQNNITQLEKLKKDVLFDVNQKDSEMGITPLHAAALGGAEQALDWLLRNGADKNPISNEGHSIVHFAGLGGQVDMLHYLKFKGYSLSDTGLIGLTLADFAQITKLPILEDMARINNIPLAKDINAPQITPLHTFAAQGQISNMQKALETGVPIDIKGPDGFTALLLSALNGEEKMVEFLLEKGANINAKLDNGFTILHCAAAGGSRAVLDIIEKYDFPLDSTGNCKMTIADMADIHAASAVKNFIREKGIPRAGEVGIYAPTRKAETGVKTAGTSKTSDFSKTPETTKKRFFKPMTLGRR